MERELRVRSRQRSLPWIRVGVGLLATLIGLVALQNAERAGGMIQAGKILLAMVSWPLFAFCLLEGARQTVDSVSREQREGTLGLLFLTDLNGLDVVLGKLVAALTHTFYGVLAAFPVMGIALLAGGVTAGEFWRTQLALVVTLLVATAAGLWVSSRSQDDLRSTLGTALLLIGLTILPAVVELANPPRWLPIVSPAMLLAFADDALYRTGSIRFWGSVLLLLGLGLTLVGLSATGVKRSWRESSAETARPPRKVRNPDRWNYRIAPGLHARTKSPQLDRHPAVWLAGRLSGSVPLIWLGLMVSALPVIAIPLLYNLVGRGGGTAAAMGFSIIGLLSSLLGAGLLAFVAVRPFQEGRRSGTLELLLSTPLSVPALVQAHWLALWQRLRLPLILVFALHLLQAMYQIGALLSGVGSGFGVFALSQAVSTLLWIVQPLAICWVGLWSGLAARNTSQAVGWTMVLVQIAPWMLSYLLWLGITLIFPMSWIGVPPWWHYLPFLAFSLLGLAWPIALIFWARRRLLGRFRELASAPGGLRLAWPWRPRLNRIASRGAFLHGESR
ncbi:MAG: ABC transporter permease [Limisphaerales bacterium]